MICTVAIWLGWLALTQWAAGAQPGFTLTYQPVRQVACQMASNVQLPGFLLHEWVFFQLQPPATPRQDVVVSVTGGRPGQEEGPLHRPLVFVDALENPDVRDPALSYTVTYTGVLRRTDLVPLQPGEKPVTVPPLTERERKLYLAETSMIDFSAPVVRQWLDSASLHRRPGESDLDLARRIYLAMRTTFHYGSSKNSGKASEMVEGRVGVCVNLSRVYAAALRANQIPVRVLNLNRADSDGTSTVAAAYGHATNEFYVSGIGWVPADLTKCVGSRTDEDALRSFGHDAGNYIILFNEDQDILVNTRTFGSAAETPAATARTHYSVRVPDRIEHAFWAFRLTGAGSNKAQRKDEWQVHQSIEPSLYRDLQVEGQPQPADGLGVLIWHDSAGWHIHTRPDGNRHEFYVRVHPEAGAIDRWNHAGARLAGQPKPELDEDQFTDREFGFDFTPSPATKYLRISIKIDKSEACESLIQVGKTGWHPLMLPLYLPANR